MKAYRINLPASPATQIVRQDGRGYIQMLTISHAESSPQQVTLYQNSGVVLAAYQVSPQASPYTLTFPPYFPLWFVGGLAVNTGACLVNLIAVY
jgi:hypothetical protein